MTRHYSHLNLNSMDVIRFDGNGLINKILDANLLKDSYSKELYSQTSSQRTFQAGQLMYLQDGQRAGTFNYFLRFLSYLIFFFI